MEKTNGISLRCDNLFKSYGEQDAIKGLSCDLPVSSLGLLGPNGSGKTTLIKLMLGLIQPTSGSIKLNVAKENTRVVPDRPILPSELTVDQWISLQEELHGENLLEIDVQTLFQLNGEWRLKNLSAGQKRKAALIPIFFGNPDVIVLDEPTNFLDIVAREQILKLLKDYFTNIDTKLILATHRITEMRSFCKDILILKEGQIVRKVSLVNEQPQSFTISVNNEKVFENLLKEKTLNFIKEEDYQGTFFRISPHPYIWNLIEEFRKDGGVIFRFETNDSLKHAIEELLT